MLSLRETLLPFHKPMLGAEELAQLSEVLESGWVTRGPKTERFEEAFREYTGARCAVGVNSATSGLHLALVALGIGAGDEVITTPITYCATPNEIEHAGAVPVFADVDPETYLLDPRAVEAAITPRTRAIMPVHLYGQSADMDALRAIARKYGLAIVADAAHAIETTWRDEKIATAGDAVVFSFYANKNITTGEGGMITTMDPELAQRLRRLSLHGISRDAWSRRGAEYPARYSLNERGYKYHMFDLVAALGLAQLPKIEAWWNTRKALWARYEEGLAGLAGVRPIPHRMPGRHAYHLRTVEIDPAVSPRDRNEVAAALMLAKIATGIHYEAMHLQPYYATRYGLRPEDLPNATHASQRVLSLPLYPLLSMEDVDDVVNGLRSAVGAI